MTGLATATGTRTDATAAPPRGPLHVVRVVDIVDERIAGHCGCAYTSPAQSRDDALTLAGVLLGGPVAAGDGDECWTRAVAIAGGRRTVTLERADRAR